MFKKTSEKYVIISLIVLGFTAIIFWLLYNPSKDLLVNIAGQDHRPEKDTISDEIINIGKNFTFYSEYSSNLNGKWPRFRGADFDNINKENIRLIDKWPETGPDICWEVELGEGHAAPVIFNGMVYILDYHEIKKADQLRCFSLETGEEIWRRWYKVHIKRNHGISRTIPAITEKFIVTIGPRGHVMCCNPQSGEFLWGIDLEKEYNTEIPFWYTGQCPLIDDDVVVIAPCGDVLLLAVDCNTGEIVWQSPNPDKWKMSHSSIIPFTFKGKRMYVYAAIGGICGISAEGNDVGNILWKTNDFAPSVVAPSPVILDNDKIFISAGYGAGSMLFQVTGENDNPDVKILQKYKPKEGLSSEQQTPLFHNGLLYSIQPKDAGTVRNQFVCCKPDDCTNIIWTSGKDERFGLGPYILADGKFFILDDDGTLTIARASVENFIYLDKVKVMNGQDAWGPMAIADGRLLLRDSKKMMCVDIRKSENYTLSN